MSKDDYQEVSIINNARKALNLRLAEELKGRKLSEKLSILEIRGERSLQAKFIFWSIWAWLFLEIFLLTKVLLESDLGFGPKKLVQVFYVR